MILIHAQQIMFVVIMMETFIQLKTNMIPVIIMKVDQMVII